MISLIAHNDNTWEKTLNWLIINPTSQKIESHATAQVALSSTSKCVRMISLMP